MTTITTRNGKGSPLTSTELDENFTNLNTDKVNQTQVLTDVPVDAVFTDTVDDANEILRKLKTVDGEGSRLDADRLQGQRASAFLTPTGDGSQLTGLPSSTGATAEQVLAIEANTDKVSNVDHPLVETAVPLNAVFTDNDTVYDDSALAEAVALNTEKLTNSTDASDLTSGTLADGIFPSTLPAISGENLTNLPSSGAATTNASDLTSGTLPDGRFPATLPIMSGENLTDLPNINASDIRSGTLRSGRFPDTLPAVSGANLTNLPTYDDTAILLAIGLNTDKVSNVEHPLVEKAVPDDALFTDTTYAVGDGGLTTNDFTDDDHTKLNNIETNADVTDTTNVVASLTAGNNITIAADGTIASTNTDTVYDSTAIDIAVGLNTDKVSNVDHPLVETAVPTGALFTDTTYTSASFTLSDLQGFNANEHINWGAASQGTIHSTNLPAIAITSVQTATNRPTHLALTTEEGDVVIRTDQNKTYIRNAGLVGDLTDFTEIISPTGGVTSVDGVSGAVSLDHDTLTGYVAAEHVDWALAATPNIHTSNYTNTVYDDTDIVEAVRLNTLKVSNIAHPTVGVEVPTDAVFTDTDTIYDDTALALAVGLNTSKVSNVEHPLVETAVPDGAVFTDTVFTDADAVSAVVASDLDMDGNKVLFGNVYSLLENLPAAADYHGMFAHVHNTGRGYFAHQGNWVSLANESDLAAINSAVGLNSAKVTNYDQSKEDIEALGIAADSITGALPAIDGSALTNLPDTGTTYEVGDGGLTQKNFTTTLNTKLASIADSANNYSLPDDVVLQGELIAWGGALHATDALSISGHTITLRRGNSAVETVIVPDNDTTYSVGDGGLTQHNFTTDDHNKLNGIAASANNYSLPASVIHQTELSDSVSDNSTTVAANVKGVKAAYDRAWPNTVYNDTALTTSVAGKLPLTGGSMTGRLKVLDVKETVVALTGTAPSLNPANGTMQTWTLPGTSNPTFDSGFGDGESITLMISDGSSRTISWPAIQWAGGSPPDLATSGYTVIVLWRVGSTFYGQHAGDVS